MTSTIRELFVYPIKSLEGIACDELVVGDRGAVGDRRWMLVDEEGRFITQREHPKLCRFNVSRGDSGYVIQSSDVSEVTNSIQIPFALENGSEKQVQVWSDTMLALEASHEVNHFFREALSMPCKLVYMPEYSHRFADAAYTGERVLNSFSDGYPLLLIGSASLDELNERLMNVGEHTIGWDRFRPNIVATTQEPHCEDSWASFTLGEVQARGVKLCSRCVFTTINQRDGRKGKEPLKTLATYRNMGGKIMFGQNVVAMKGTIRVGDSIEVIASGYPPNAKF
ncbi:MAG: MOSC domain-containing protein [Flavobacteriales bacterium]